MRKTNREREARIIAAALIETGQRYHDGLMSHATYRVHNRALWDRAVAEQVDELVKDRLRMAVPIPGESKTFKD